MGQTETISDNKENHASKNEENILFEQINKSNINFIEPSITQKNELETKAKPISSEPLTYLDEETATELSEKLEGKINTENESPTKSDLKTIIKEIELLIEEKKSHSPKEKSIQDLTDFKKNLEKIYSS